MLTSETAVLYPDASSFSLLYYIKEPSHVVLFFGVYFLLTIMLLVGFKTKVIALLCYVFLYSIHQRVAPFLYGGDDALRIALFWAIFLPLDIKYSLFKKGKVLLTPYSGFNIFALLFQISLIYFFNALLKNGDTWQNGSAVAYAASIFEHKAKYSDLLIEHYWAGGLLTYLTLLFEFSIPFLIFSPFKNHKTRMIASMAIIIFHFGLIPFLDVNTFYLSTLPFAVIVLPGHFWNWMENKILNNV